MTRLTETGHQTPMVTSRWDLRAIVVAYRMFERWRQENFFKYLREEYLIDALVDYQVEPDDPNRSVPNPVRKAFEKEIYTARVHLRKLRQSYGATAIDYVHGRLGTEMLGIASDFQKSFRTGAKQEIVEDLLILQHHRGQMVHCVVPAGGLSAGRTRWITPRYAFFLPVQVLSRVFRGKFVDALQQAFRHGQLRFEGDLTLLAQPKIFAAWLCRTVLAGLIGFLPPTDLSDVAGGSQMHQRECRFRRVQSSKAAACQ